MLGDRFVDRRRLAEILQSQGNLNTGDTFGGLAHVLQQYLVGRETGRERQEQQAAMDAFTQGASAKPWVNPDTGETMGQAGGLLGAQYALSQLQGNPTAGRLSSQLMMQQLDRDEERRQWEDRFNTQNQAQMDRFRMEQEAADRRFQQQLAVQREIAQMRMAAPSEAPSSIREWQAFQQMTPEQQQQYLTMKRANPYLNLGDVFAQPDPLNPGQVRGEIGVGIKPQREIIDGTVHEFGGVAGNPRPQQNGDNEQRAAPPLQQDSQYGATGGGPSLTNTYQLPPSQKKLVAQQSLSTNLADLANVYLRLDELGGVVNPDRGVVANMATRAGASDVGQLVGQFTGSEIQSVRERINNMRPLLVQTIRQATEMSARGMDSNRELEFYLQAATKPTGDIYSNLAAIQVLDQTFGLGNVLESTLPPDVYQRVKTQANIQARERPITITPDQLESPVPSQQFMPQQQQQPAAPGGWSIQRIE